MSKEEIYTAVQILLFEKSGDLRRDEYRELLQDIQSECQDALNALDDDEKNNP